MKFRAWFAACVFVLIFCPALVTASGPIAVYALIDKVTYEPDSGTPDRVRISGVFIVAEQSDNSSYSAPNAATCISGCRRPTAIWRGGNGRI